MALCWVKSPGANPYQSLAGLREYWGDPGKTNIRWKAPDGIYWICGKKAYSELPPRWKGSCTLGMIQPVFLTLPQTKSNLLGAPL
ncbi:ENR1 protein, partial [Halcyon senegalensis]|nr:ENR1 protein [Halcyon senegalensis]